jgi:UDP-N-acetylmuramoyl-L-alanine---L-glutamate ligase
MPHRWSPLTMRQCWAVRSGDDHAGDGSTMSGLASLQGRHLAVWGAGVEGRAAVAFLKRWAAPASLSVIVDSARPTDPTVIDGVPVIDLSAGGVLPAAEVIVKSPGVSPYGEGFRSAVGGRAVLGGTSLWFSEASTSNTGPLDRTIGVTGSKGKSTTSSLIAHLLRSLIDPDDVVLAGNVGRAPLDVLDEGLTSGAPFPTRRWHVFELSSFQAAEVAASPRFGVLTSLFPEHLDWHRSVDRYYADKLNLFLHGLDRPTVLAANMANTDVKRLCEHAEIDLRAYGISSGFHVADSGAVWDGDQMFAAADALPLVGAHNAANVCAALTILRAAGFELQSHQQLLGDSLRTFRPLAHRLEPVGMIDGRLVIDDSLSTAPQAAVAALNAYSQRPVGIIVGGHDRGLDYAALAEACAARQLPLWVVGVPQSGGRIVEVIERACAAVDNQFVRCSLVQDFDSAPELLLRSVPSNGVLLLSPAAPSFGRFTDYKARGLRFRELLGLT